MPPQRTEVRRAYLIDPALLRQFLSEATADERNSLLAFIRNRKSAIGDHGRVDQAQVVGAMRSPRAVEAPVERVHLDRFLKASLLELSSDRERRQIAEWLTSWNATRMKRLVYRPEKGKGKNPHKVKKRKCYAVLASWRYSSYQCPSHGMLGGLSEAVAHAVANQFDVDVEPVVRQ